LDVDRFEELAGSAPSRPSELDAAAALRAALALWRGPALHDLPLDACRSAATRLDERRLVVVERRIDLDLRLGNFADLAAELAVLVREYPLRERLWAQLMLALYGAGRQADALAAFRALRARLVEQLGIEPSVLPRQVERSVLAGGDALATYFRELGDPATEPVPASKPVQIPDSLAMSAQMVAFSHQAATGKPITLATLAEKLGVNHATARQLLTHLGHDIPTPAVPERVNGSPIVPGGAK